MSGLPFVDNGALATEVSQCPHAPSTEAWKAWQHEFIFAQTNNPERFATAKAAADGRLAAAGLKVAERPWLYGLGPCVHLTGTLNPNVNLMSPALSQPCGIGPIWNSNSAGWSALKSHTMTFKMTADDKIAFRLAFDVPPHMIAAMPANRRKHRRPNARKRF